MLTKHHPYQWEQSWTGEWITHGRGLQKWGGKFTKEGVVQPRHDWTTPGGSLADVFEV